MFCCTLLCVRSSIAIILMGKRELVALLNLSSWCLVMVERLFLAMPQGCLRFVIAVFPDHTHLLFFYIIAYSRTQVLLICFYELIIISLPFLFSLVIVFALALFFSRLAKILVFFSPPSIYFALALTIYPFTFFFIYFFQFAFFVF